MKRVNTATAEEDNENSSDSYDSNHDESNPSTQGATSTDEPTKSRKTVSLKKAKLPKPAQRFQNSWLSENQFKDWLEKRAGFPYCKLCDCKLSCAKTALRRHVENKKHNEISRIKRQVTSPLSLLLGSRERAARMEIKLCHFIVEKNLPLSIVDDLLPVLRDLFPSDETLRQVTLGKQKATNIIRQVLGFHSIELCVSKLRTNKFSLIIDETTDRSTTSQLAILGIFFDEHNFRLETVMIDLIPLPNGAAATIYESLIKSLKDKDIPMRNVIGFCADTCNVMFGVNHSVAQMLVRDYPWIVAVKCSSHLIHLCSSYASTKLPKSLEDLCRNIYSHFSLSSKRTVAFKEFQEFLKLEELRILKPGILISNILCLNMFWYFSLSRSLILLYFFYKSSSD